MSLNSQWTITHLVKTVQLTISQSFTEDGRFIAKFIYFPINYGDFSFSEWIISTPQSQSPIFCLYFARYIWSSWENQIAKHRKGKTSFSALLLSFQCLVILLLTVSWHHVVFISLRFISILISVSLQKVITLFLLIGIQIGIPYQAVMPHYIARCNFSRLREVWE